MTAPRIAAAPRGQAFWLASRGIQQLDLAARFASAAEAQGLRVLALKGISIADELYRELQNRPMADIDFLVVDTDRFETVVDLARSLGLAEIGASDHALVFKESASGVVLELHVSLTACPGLFPVNHQALWEEREPVPSTTMFRLSNLDMLVHLSLHAAFQHALAANEYHYDDFVRGLEAWDPPVASLMTRAGEWRALPALALMTLACRQRRPDSRILADLALKAAPHCPKGLTRWLDSQAGTPPPRILSMAYVRYGLAPSKVRYARQTLFPKPIPGRTLRVPKAWRRLLNLAEAGLAASPVPPAPSAATLPERLAPPELAESWIRECLALHPEGARLTVSGTCMEPALPEGLQISLRLPRRTPRVGDVVLIRTPAGLRLHRVLMRFQERIRTKGDRGVYLDPRASMSDVIAVWDSTETRSRRLLRTGASLARILARPRWRGPGALTPGDEAHVRLLP